MNVYPVLVGVGKLTISAVSAFSLYSTFVNTFLLFSATVAPSPFGLNVTFTSFSNTVSNLCVSLFSLVYGRYLLVALPSVSVRKFAVVSFAKLNETYLP